LPKRGNLSKEDLLLARWSANRLDAGYNFTMSNGSTRIDGAMEKTPMQTFIDWVPLVKKR
jgi:hypothetical protein